MRIAVVMVGLPATGKTFAARNLSRYLRWMGVPTRTFHAAAYRRAIVGADVRASFFDASNAALLALRTRVADAVLEDMLGWLSENGAAHEAMAAFGNGVASAAALEESGAKTRDAVATDGDDLTKTAYDDHRVAILDAANTRAERRAVIHEACTRRGVQVLFVECAYTAGSAARRLVPVAARELRLAAPEYAGMDARAALADYVRRIALYVPHYVPLSADTALASSRAMRITLVDGGERVVAAHVHGFIPSRVLFYLTHARSEARRVMLAALPPSPGALGVYASRLHSTLCRGESPVMARRSVASDSESVLSVHLDDVSSAIFSGTESDPCCTHSQPRPCEERVESTESTAGIAPFAVWTETSSACGVLREVFGPGHALQAKPQLRALDSALARSSSAETDAPSAIGSAEWAAFCARPMTHRVVVPGGEAEVAESYRDLALRLEHAILELEASKTDVLVVAHPSVLRVIYAYFVSGGDSEGSVGASALDARMPPTRRTSESLPSAYTGNALSRRASVPAQFPPADAPHTPPATVGRKLLWEGGESIDAVLLRMHPFPADAVVVLETRPYGVIERRVDLSS